MPHARPLPKFLIFVSQAVFREWLVKNHAKAQELWVGYYKKSSGKKSMSYKEAVDEALCFGWIDGVSKSFSDEVYGNRFTPRRKTSIWSAVNLRRFDELVKAGRVHLSGLRAFEARDPRRAGLYPNENPLKRLDPEMERRFRANEKAWAFFETQPPGYKKTALFLVMSAKKPETRERRFNILLKDSARGLRLAQLSPNRKRSKA
jgi:uncharacterized protein YdeI (YjbR/CyaY-like superfamily)